MKIYTEEQVKVLISALDDIRDWDDDLEVGYDDAGSRADFALNDFSHLTPIQLPTDEEIEKKSYNLFHQNDNIGKGTWIYGAIWIKEQILNQNK